MKRALELGLFLKMDTVDLERLVYLALQDDESPELRDYFSRKLSEEMETEGYFHLAPSSAQPSDEMLVVPEHIYSDISLLAIFDVIGWADGRIRPDEIANCLYTFPELSDPVVMSEKLQKLERAGYIEIVRDEGDVARFNYVKKKLRFSITRESAPRMAQYAENYTRFLRHPRNRGWIASGFIKIPKERLSAVKKRMLGFRNWLMEIDTEVGLDPGASRENTLVFQLDVNLFCLVDSEALGYPPLNSWMDTEH